RHDAADYFGNREALRNRQRDAAVATARTPAPARKRLGYSEKTFELGDAHGPIFENAAMSRLRVKSCVAPISRTVPVFDRITSDCVGPPPGNGSRRAASSRR